MASQMTVSGEDLNARPVARPGEVVYRGGSWYQDRLTARSDNREVVEPNDSHPFYGLRICATP